MSDPLVFGCRVNASGASGVGVRCNGNASLLFSDVDGVTSDLRVETGAVLSVYANQYETTAGSGTIQALRGDRSAWDVVNYPAFHAKDIEDSNPVYHNPAGAATGQAPVWNGSEWVPTDITTQAELDAVKDESFVVMAATADLANERVLTAGANITITDGGAGGAVTIAAEGGGGHVHGLTRWNADGGATFDLPDVAEYIDFVGDAGSLVDPAIYSLSVNQDQIVFDSAPTAGNVIQAGYVIAQV